MAKEKTYKCSYKHCKHESPEVSGDIAVKVGNRYMHPDCAKINEYINKTRDLYYEKVSSTVVMPQLVKTINNIVLGSKNKKPVDAEYLYFALQYDVTHDRKVKYPGGLYYLIDNYKIKKAWKERNREDVRSVVNEKISENEKDFDPIQEAQNSNQYKSEEFKGFASIFDM